MDLSTCKRIVLFSTNPKDETEIEFRHFGISARQRQVNKSIKKLVNSNKIPNLAAYNDISDFFMKRRNAASTNAYSSESEIDDLPGSKVTLPTDYLDKKKNTNVALRLHELGPRMKLKLVKI